MDSQDLAAVLVPVVTAATGLLGIIWQDWRQRRSTSDRRRIALEDAIRQVAFAEKWWQVSQAIQPGTGSSPESTAAIASCLKNALTTMRAAQPAPLSAPRSPIRAGDTNHPTAFSPVIRVQVVDNQ